MHRNTRAKILRDLQTGYRSNAIAAELGIPASEVREIAYEEGYLKRAEGRPPSPETEAERRERELARAKSQMLRQGYPWEVVQANFG